MLFAVTLLYYKTQHQDLTFVEFKGFAKIRFFHRKQKPQPIKKEHTTYVIYSINFICKDPRGSEGITEQSDVIVFPRGSEGIRFASQNSGVFQSKTMKKSQNI